MIDEEMILKRTFSVYSRYGIKSVAVDDIAFMLGMSKKTIYEHFKNRKTLIQKAISNNIKSFLSDLEKAISAENDVFAQLAMFYVQIIRSMKKINPSFVHDLKKYSNEQYRIIVQLRDEKLFDIFSHIVKAGIANGLFMDDTEGRYLYYNQIEKTSALIYDFKNEVSLGSFSPRVIYQLILNDIRGMTTLKGHAVFEEKYDLLQKML